MPVAPIVGFLGDDASLFQQVVAAGTPLIPGITRLGAGRLFGTTKLFHMGEFIQLVGLGFAADAALALFLALFQASGSLGLMPVVEPVVFRLGNFLGLCMRRIVLASACSNTLFFAGGGGGHFPFAPIMCVGVNGDGLLPSAVAVGFSGTLRILIVASILCKARFSAGGLFDSVLG